MKKGTNDSSAALPLYETNNKDNKNHKTNQIYEDLLKTHKTIRIAPSGDVMITKLECQIIDTKEFQRLRAIKQLGTTYLTYPTAIHTRFDHSLGTVYMADMLIRKVRENKHSETEEKEIKPEEEIIIRLYALLHDISHIPFGHTLEDEFRIIDKHDEDIDNKMRFLGKDKTIGRLLFEGLGKAPDLYERLMRLFTISKDKLNELGNDRFLYEIVNNTVCADLLDYLTRDSFFCNVVLDIDYRFLNYVYIATTEKGKQLAIRLWKSKNGSGGTPRKDILSELIRLMETRYLLGERVYFHHTKLITDTMIASAIQRELISAKKVLDLNYLFQHGDESVLDKLEESDNEEVKKLIESIRNRTLWKTVYEIYRDTVETIEAHNSGKNIFDDYREKYWDNPAERLRMENLLAELCSLEPGDILMICPDSKMAMKTAAMNVFWKGKITPLKDCKGGIIEEKLGLILKSHSMLWCLRVYVNPIHVNNKLVVSCCKYLLSPDSEERKQNGIVFWNQFIDEYTNEKAYSETFSANEYNRKKGSLVAQLLEPHFDLRNKIDYLRLIDSTFSK